MLRICFRNYLTILNYYYYYRQNGYYYVISINGAKVKLINNSALKVTNSFYPIKNLYIRTNKNKINEC